MLNLQLVDAMYNGLTKDQQQQLLTALFKKSKQNMNYFHRTKDISMSKLEILADFFNVSLDSLRLGGRMRTNIVPGNHNNVSCNFVNSDVQLEKQALEDKVATLQERNQDLKARIADKEEMISLYKQMLGLKQEKSDSTKTETVEKADETGKETEDAPMQVW
jgi:hypothetical protein